MGLKILIILWGFGEKTGKKRPATQPLKPNGELQIFFGKKKKGGDFFVWALGDFWGGGFL